MRFVELIRSRLRRFRRWQPCEHEDGSGQRRCIWDASRMGNGIGQSYMIINGGKDDARYIRISHRRARRLLRRR